MSGSTTYAWVVPIPDDNFVKTALVSARALKSTKTCGQVAAVVSTSVSKEFIKKIDQFFDLVLIKDHIQFVGEENGSNISKITKEEFFLDQETLFGLLNLATFSKIIVIHPEIVTLRQLDHLFDLFTATQALLMKSNLGKVLGAGICPPKRKHSENSPDFHNFGENCTTANVEILDETFWNNEEKMSIMPDMICVKSKDLEKIEPRFLPKLDENIGQREKNWIAVVGMSCRFPGANSLEEYWNILKNGQNTSGQIPKNRTKFCDGIGKNSYGNFLKCQVDEFDPGFFGMSPTEAVFTDPQARLLLEVSWEAFENAGINPDKLKGSSTGIFHGSWLQEYKEAMNEASGVGTSKNDFMRKYLGNSFGSTAAKLSFFYGFTGENVATESGCSSSMVAFNMACQSLLRRDCPVAMVTGANVILQMDDKQKVLWAPDGKCKTFDVSANGYARAEGIAVLILKRYSDALRDKDRIHGVILGGATSQEGMSKNFGAPTVDSEAKVMKLALEKSGLDPNDVDYLEAHATGTGVGDPIEAHAICMAYRSESKMGQRSLPLMIASGKTNIGHTESVSGLAGIIKVLLAFKYEMIPKHLHLTQLNPQVCFDSIPGMVPTEIVPWRQRTGKNPRPRIAGVSSFGITGTDVHILLQEPPLTNVTLLSKDIMASPYPSEVLAFSAKTTTTLDQLETQYLNQINPENICDAVFTSNTCRSHNLGVRKALVLSRTTAQIIQKFQTIDSTKPKICFTFPGVISSMEFTPAQILYKTCLPFRKTMNKCNSTWIAMFPSKSTILNALEKLWKSDEAKPHVWYACILSIQFSLSQLWTSWGVQPDVVIGQCMGEATALTICGAISLEDAFRFLIASEYLLDGNKICPGAMMAINCDNEACQQLISHIQKDNSNIWIDIAILNSPFQTVVASSPENLELLKEMCAIKGIKCHQLTIDYPVHSRLVEESCKKAEKEVFSNIRHNLCKIPYISSATGERITEDDLCPAFWCKMLRCPVQFTKACLKADQLGCNIFIEIGLGAALTAFTLENIKNSCNTTCLPSFLKNKGDGCWTSLISDLGQLYACGVDINWLEFYKFCPERMKMDLPHYPFQRKSFWFEKRCGNPINFGQAQFRHHPLVGVSVPNCLGKSIFNFWINRKTVPYIYDHLIGEHVIFPGAGFMEIMMTVVEMKLKNTGQVLILKDFKIYLPVLLDENEKCLQTLLWQEEKSQWIVQIYTKINDDQWSMHTSGNVLVLSKASMETHSDVKFEETENARYAVAEFYEHLARFGLKFGQNFKSLKSIQRNLEETIIQITAPGQISEYFCHPILVDAMIQGFMAHKNVPKDKLQVPVKIGSFTVKKNIMKTITEGNRIYLICSTNKVNLLTVDGMLIASMENLEFVKTDVQSILRAAGLNKNKNQNSIEIYDILWELSKFYQPSRIAIGKGKNVLESFGFQKLRKDLALRNEYNLEEQKFDDDMNKLCKLYVLMAMFEMGWKPRKGQISTFEELSDFLEITPNLIPAFQHFLTFLSPELSKEGRFYQVNSVPNDHEKVKMEINILENKISGYSAMETIKLCGSKMALVLQGQISGQKILFGNMNKTGSYNLAEHYYQTARFGKVFSELVKIFSVLCFELDWKSLKEPLKILEIGAGTGAFTTEVVPVLDGQGIKFQYHFTDISQVFLGKAEEKFQTKLDSFVFKTLNIEDDALGQGFSPNYFDVIVAVDVLHVTKNLRKSLKNLEILLKGGGRVLILETEKPTREVDICFGILEGYWQFDDGIRKRHCTVPATTWLQILNEVGFKSDNCAMYACQNQVSLITGRLTKHDETMSKLEVESIKQWIIFHDVKLEHPGLIFVKNFQKKMSQLGRHVLIISIDGILNKVNLESILEEYGANLEGIIYYVNGISVKYPPPPPNCQVLLEPLLILSKYLINGKRLKSLPRLHLVTSRCWNSSKINNCLSGILWGFMRTFRMELPGIISRSIDISEEDDDFRLHILINEIWLDDKETEVCYREGQRFVRRMKLIEENKCLKIEIPVIMETSDFTVEFPESKNLEDVKYVGRDFMKNLEENEVEIEVRCSSLNFKDVLTIMASDKVFEKMKMLGLDYSGIITEIGSKVSCWKVGDFVFGCNFKENIVASRTRIGQDWLMKIPENLTFSEAAGFPTVFITAWYCLANVAKLKSGDVILIHAASGGVGLIAIQIAKYLGAKIVGTAGSPRKREFLRRLGVVWVFNSRNVEFRDQIRNSFGGKLCPVDVVLNCLTGPDFKEASLDILKDGGHFVEISKLAIWREWEVKELRPLVNYKVVNAMDFESSIYQELMQKLVELLNFGKIRPLPCSIYRADEIISALKFLKKANHIGKVILEMPRNSEQLEYSLFNDRSTYFISGGTGAIGMAVAKWMIGQGAKYIVLGARSPVKDVVNKVIDDLVKENNCKIIFWQIEISDYGQCKELFKSIQDDKNWPPIRGIHHCSGILSDKLIGNQTWESFDKVLRAKVQGAWNLHNISIEMELSLEYFVLYSSLCSTFGNIGQSNYTAANCYMDCLADMRRSLGLPGISINWGKWNVGIAENIDVDLLVPFSLEDGVKCLEQVMTTERNTSGKGIVGAGIFNSGKLLKMAPYFEKTLLEHLPLTSSGQDSGGVKDLDSRQVSLENVNKNVKLKEIYGNGKTKEERSEIVRKFVTRVLCETLGIGENEMDLNTPISNMGMDSLMSIEFTNKLVIHVGGDSMDGFEIGENATVLSICQLLESVL